MESGKYFLLNDNIVASGKAVLTADNRSFRFGDGFFETMKMIDGEIALSHYHFERLFASLQSFQFDIPDFFTAENLSTQIKKIAAKNKHQQLARIRLTIFRSDGSLYDYENNFPNYIIQTWALDAGNISFNKKGLITGIYLNARKSCDDFSHIKTNSFLPYAMGALWAKSNDFNDAIILNNYNRVADATIANIFVVKDGRLLTPSLSEGCISGVMRRYLIECIRKDGIPFQEVAITTEQLKQANELFITNAVKGINWIAKCDGHNYTLQLSKYLHEKFF